MKNTRFMALRINQPLILVALILSLICITTPEITLLVGCLYSSLIWSFSNENDSSYNFTIWLSFIIVTFIQVFLSESSAIFYLACAIYTANLIRNLLDMRRVTCSRIHIVRAFTYLSAIFLSLYLEPSVKQILIPLLIVLIMNKTVGRAEYA